MTSTDKLVLLALLLAILLLPPALGALHERPRRAEEPIRVVVERYRSPTPPPTPHRPRPTDVPRPTATIWIMPEWPTPNPWRQWPPAIMLPEGMRISEAEAVEWLEGSSHVPDTR